MRFYRRTSTALTAFLTLSAAAVSGAALVASGRVDASATNVVCVQEIVDDDDRLRVNLSFVEELFASLRPQDGHGGARNQSPGCETDDRTGVDLQPPARLSFRFKNFDAEPLVDTNQVREDAKGLANGAVRAVNEAKDPVLQEANRTLEGPKQQVVEGARPVVDGTNQLVGGTKQQVVEGARPVVDGTSQVLGGTQRVVDDASRTLGDTARLFDAQTWAELQR